MMRPSHDLPAVYLCRDIVDFHKGINGLTELVEEVLQQDPFSEQLFVFCNRKRDSIIQGIIGKIQIKQTGQ
ncbi:MAG: IS66 family insertion sequence element accessory protein TnpB, partial [Gammaproteobacteria bacterium]